MTLKKRRCAQTQKGAGWDAGCNCLMIWDEYPLSQGRFSRLVLACSPPHLPLISSAFIHALRICFQDARSCPVAWGEYHWANTLATPSLTVGAMQCAAGYASQVQLSKSPLYTAQPAHSSHETLPLNSSMAWQLTWFRIHVFVDI
jgi:hypothetical protein